MIKNVIGRNNIKKNSSIYVIINLFEGRKPMKKKKLATVVATALLISMISGCMNPFASTPDSTNAARTTREPVNNLIKPTLSPTPTFTPKPTKTPSPTAAETPVVKITDIPEITVTPTFTPKPTFTPGPTAIVEHIWGEPVIEKEATCTEEGTLRYSCTVEGCIVGYTENIPALGHTPGNVITTEATVTECGHKKTYCARCNEVILDEVTLPVTPTDTPTPTPTTNPITAVDDYIYTLRSLNLREEPNTDSAIITKFPAREKLHRVGIYENGWNVVDYNSDFYFISGKYTTTDESKVPTPTPNPTEKALQEATEKIISLDAEELIPGYTPNDSTNNYLWYSKIQAYGEPDEGALSVIVNNAKAYEKALLNPSATPTPFYATESKVYEMFGDNYSIETYYLRISDDREHWEIATADNACEVVKREGGDLLVNYAPEDTYVWIAQNGAWLYDKGGNANCYLAELEAGTRLKVIATYESTCGEEYHGHSEGSLYTTWFKVEYKGTIWETYCTNISETPITSLSDEDIKELVETKTYGEFADDILRSFNNYLSDEWYTKWDEYNQRYTFRWSAFGGDDYVPRIISVSDIKRIIDYSPEYLEGFITYCKEKTAEIEAWEEETGKAYWSTYGYYTPNFALSELYDCGFISKYW